MPYPDGKPAHTPVPHHSMHVEPASSLNTLWCVVEGDHIHRIVDSVELAVQICQAQKNRNCDSCPWKATPIGRLVQASRIAGGYRHH